MILDEIAEKTRARVEEDKKNIPFVDMRNEAERLAAELSKENCPKLFPFYQALKSPGISFICEVKKASPSKGVIAEEFPYLEIAKEYEGKAKIVKVDIDESMDLAQKYRIMSVPNMIIFKDGAPVDAVIGAVPANHLKEKLDAVL